MADETLRIPVVTNESVPRGVVVLASTDEATPRIGEPVTFLVAGYVLDQEPPGGPKDGEWAGPFMLRFQRSDRTFGYDLVLCKVKETAATDGYGTTLPEVHA